MHRLRPTREHDSGVSAVAACTVAAIAAQANTQKYSEDSFLTELLQPDDLRCVLLPAQISRAASCTALIHTLRASTNALRSAPSRDAMPSDPRPLAFFVPGCATRSATFGTS